MPQSRYAVVYHTNADWLRYLQINRLDDWANFWTGRQTTLRLEEEMPFFFKLETQVIAGYGTYKEQRTETLDRAWRAYGEHNGVQSKADFLSRAGDALRIPSPNDNSLIRSIVLTDLVFLSTPPTLASVGLNAFQTVRYIDEEAAVRILATNLRTDANTSQVSAVVSGAQASRTIVNSRPYQAYLRRQLMRTYGSKCAICGLDEANLLYASHIIPHHEATKLKRARRLDNAILLCSLHNDLFDKGFISLELLKSGRYHILVSKRLSSSSNSESVKVVNELRSFDFAPPSQYPPAGFSLKFHRREVFLG